MRHSIIALLMVLAGILLTGGGLAGFYSLYAASRHYERTEGVIKSFTTKKIRRYRKLRYEHEMQICYPTSQYGNMSVSEKSYWPFRSAGDSLTVWYHPERPYDIHLPDSEWVYWASMTALGLFCIYGGVIIRKKN